VALNTDATPFLLQLNYEKLSIYLFLNELQNRKAKIQTPKDLFFDIYQKIN